MVPRIHCIGMRTALLEFLTRRGDVTAMALCGISKPLGLGRFRIGFGLRCARPRLGLSRYRLAVPHLGVLVA